MKVMGDMMINILGLIEMYNTYNVETIYHSVAQCILENLDKVDRMSLDEIAALCNVSQSTLSRFYKMMDYPYTVSKLPEIIKVSKHQYQTKGAYYHSNYQSNETIVDQYFDHLLLGIDTIRSRLDEEKLKALLKDFLGVKEVVFLGTPMLQVVWRLQADLFLKVYKTSAYLSPSDQYRALEQIGDEAMVVYLNYASSPSDPTIDKIRQVKDRLKTLVVISNSQRHLLMGEADHSFHFEGNESEQDYLLMSMIINIISSYVHQHL